MTFVWPSMLWLLLAVPLLVAGYLALIRRQRRRFTQHAALLSTATPAGTGRWKRLRVHLPPLLMLLAVAAMVLAVARPRAVITLPDQHKTIILAIDVSLSMRATDVDPNRITAAQAAAKSFIEEVPSNVRIGIVAFGGSASLVQKPTSARDELTAAIDRFQLQYGTATGSALILSVATLFPDHGIDLEAIIYGSRANRGGRDGRETGERRNGGQNGAGAGAGNGIAGRTQQQATKQKEFTPVAPGSYESAVIILLSDGRRTTGPDPRDAAKMAADRGVKVYTVGFGTLEGGTISGFEGYSAYVRLDEEALKAVAQITHGEYYHAGTAADLRKVYQGLNTRLVMEKQETEVSALLSGAAALLAALSVLLSLAWYNRVL